MTHGAHAAWDAKRRSQHATRAGLTLRTQVTFEAPDYLGDNRWCDDWDVMCTVGYTVEGTKGKDKDERKKSVTHGSL